MMVGRWRLDVRVADAYLGLDVQAVEVFKSKIENQQSGLDVCLNQFNRSRAMKF